jgi:Ca2+-binding EF-hand superfamily protein
MKSVAFLALLAAVLLAPMPATAQAPLDTKERLDAFRKLDANEDGWISRTEAAARREVAAAFPGADKNRDGRLSFAEFETIPLSRG